MSLYRILMSPEAGREGTSTPSGEGGSTSSEEVVAITRVELDRLRARAGESEDQPAWRAEVESRIAAQEAAHARELTARDRRVDDLERAYRAALRDKELATALAGKPLIPGAAAQLIKLWREDFDVYDEGGERRVAARDGRPVIQAVAELLAGPEYAHFCHPSSRGGPDVRGANRPAIPAPPGPRNLGEAAIQRWHDSAAALRADAGRSSIGLGRRR